MSGVELSAVPHQLTDFAQLMFGLVLWARYERALFARYRLFILFALLNSCFILVASVAAGARLCYPISPALFALFARNHLVHQAIDQASEKDPGQSRRQSEKNQGPCVLDIGDLAGQSSDTSVCAGLPS